MYDSEEDDAKFRNVGWAIWFGLKFAAGGGAAKLLVKAENFDSEAGYYLAFAFCAIGVFLALELAFLGARKAIRFATRAKQER